MHRGRLAEIVTPKNQKTFSFFPTNMKFGHYRSLANSNHPTIIQTLQKLDDFIFLEGGSHFKVFKSFDMDKDSFISTQDIMAKVKKEHILTEKEEKSFIDYIDPQKKGFVTFAEFHSKVFSNVSYSEDIRSKGACPNGLLSFDKHKENLAKFENFMERKGQVIKGFRTNDLRLHVATRFGSTPPYKNTLVEHCPDDKTSFYASEKERFDRSRDHRTNFQSQDQKKKSLTDKGNIERRRERMEKFDCETKAGREKEEEFQKKKLERIANNHFLHENVKQCLPVSF